MAVTYLGIVIFMLLGAWLLYWRKKRKFNRLNEHGIEVFGSYSKKVKAETFDTLLFWVGCVSVTLSVLMIVATSDAEFVWLALSILIVFLLLRRFRSRRK